MKNSSSLTREYRFLILATHFDYSQDIIEQIHNVAQGNHKVSVFDACNNVPSLELLRTFDAALVDSCTSPFLCPDALGNVLADYVDLGGNVIVCGMSNVCSLKKQTVAGRFQEQSYHPLEYTFGTYSFNKPCFLGKIEYNHHPILHRVKSFFGGKYSAHALSSVTDEAKLIARWSDGYPLIAEKRNNKNGDSSVVALNMVAGSSNVHGSFWHAQTDGNWLLYNSLVYVADQCRFRKQFKKNLYHSVKVLSDVRFV